MQSRNEFFGVIADDDLVVINDGDGQGRDATLVEIGTGSLIGGHIVVFILHMIGRQELLECATTESTRVGIDMNVHGLLLLAECVSVMNCPVFLQVICTS
jgi:hypothetical protein